jgi:hypothetical protein
VRADEPGAARHQHAPPLAAPGPVASAADRHLLLSSRCLSMGPSRGVFAARTHVRPDRLARGRYIPDEKDTCRAGRRERTVGAHSGVRNICSDLEIPSLPPPPADHLPFPAMELKAPILNLASSDYAPPSPQPLSDHVGTGAIRDTHEALALGIDRGANPLGSPTFLSPSPSVSSPAIPGISIGQSKTVHGNSASQVLKHSKGNFCGILSRSDSCGGVWGTTTASL